MIKDYWSGKKSWFDENYSMAINLEFAEWWLSLYGAPELYEDKDEYFTRMGFAWLGWSAGFGSSQKNLKNQMERDQESGPI